MAICHGSFHPKWMQTGSDCCARQRIRNALADLSTIHDDCKSSRIYYKIPRYFVMPEDRVWPSRSDADGDCSARGATLPRLRALARRGSAAEGPPALSAEPPPSPRGHHRNVRCCWVTAARL